MEGCGGLKSFPDLMLTFIVSCVFGFIASVVFLFDIIRKGPSCMFARRSRNVMPDILRNSEFGTHHYARLPNTRLKLHYVANGPTDKPLMLCIHGFPEFWFSWRHQLKEFNKDYRVVAFDMRGYGESDRPSGICQYTVDKLVDDVDQLITELGYDKCVLVAHDWGGAVAWGYAALHPDRVDKLIVCNCPHPGAFESHIKRTFSQLCKSWYMFFFQVPMLPQLYMLADDLRNLQAAFCGREMGAKRGTLTPQDIEAYKYTFSAYENWCGPVNFYRAVFRYKSPAVEGAYQGVKITVPTLIIWGTKDGALETKLAELSSQRVEQCAVEYIEGASHWVQQEEPEQVNTAIRKFLKKSD